MLRRTILLLAAFAPLAPTALAADDDPVAVVRELYRLAGEWGGERAKQSPYAPPLSDKFFARALVRLLNEYDKRREIPRLTRDPITNSQNLKIRGLAVSLKSRQGMKAVVEARFETSDGPARLEYDLVRERGAWRVADIRSKGMQPDGMLTRQLRGR